MIKLTEVVEQAKGYNPESKKVDSSYRLRSFYINPKFIVSMVENDKFDSMHQRAPLIEELLPEARFTKMTVACGVHGTTYYNILVSPHQHMEKLNKEKK